MIGFKEFFRKCATKSLASHSRFSHEQLCCGLQPSYCRQDGWFRVSKPGMRLLEARDRFLLSSTFGVDGPGVLHDKAEEEFYGIPARYCSWTVSACFVIC